MSKIYKLTSQIDQSLQYELEARHTADREQTKNNLKSQIEHQNQTITYLEQQTN